MAEQTFTCDSCGAKGSLTYMATHDCEHNQYVDSNGGRCEDFPCCGHTDGDGCRQLESHTSDYWARQMQNLADKGYDDHEIDMLLSREDRY